ncbi:MAG: hypothetical protein M1546_06240, partial [Chloroflexi bacterium]|nr:hypothetical protein [Chloroflexota bacterium]
MEDISEPGQQVSSTNRGSQQPRRIAFLLLLGLTLLLTFGAVFAAEAFETVSPTIAPLGAHVISAVLVCALVGTITYIFWRMTA